MSSFDEGNDRDDDAVSAISIGSQLSRTRSLRSLGGRKGEEEDSGNDHPLSELSGTTGHLSASIPRLDLSQMNPCKGNDERKSKIKEGTELWKVLTEDSSESSLDEVAVHVRTPVTMRTMRGRKK